MPYIDCENSYIPNTTMKIAVTSDGRQTQYCFYPDEGYVLHINSADDVSYDENYENIISRIERYGNKMKSVSINYDFMDISSGTYTYTDDNGNEINIPVEKIGAEQLYTLPSDLVSPENIY